MNSPRIARPRPLDESVAEAIASIRYGAVEITIHDGTHRTDRKAREIAPRCGPRQQSRGQRALSVLGRLLHPALLPHQLTATPEVHRPRLLVMESNQ